MRFGIGEGGEQGGGGGFGKVRKRGSLTAFGMTGERSG